jgi:hypothetical protein
MHMGGGRKGGWTHGKEGCTSGGEGSSKELRMIWARKN